MSRLRFFTFLLFLISAATSPATAKSVEIRRVMIDNYRIDLILPPDEDPNRGSMVVLFYRTRDDSSDRFISGKISPREGRVTRIKGELLEGGKLQMRVFLQNTESGEESQMIFKLNLQKKLSAGPVELLAHLESRLY